MKLFLVNCGYYEQGLMNGLFEMHVTLPVAAISEDEAKSRAKADEFFVMRGLRAHVDGIMEIKEANGHLIRLTPSVQEVAR